MSVQNYLRNQGYAFSSSVRIGRVLNKKLISKFNLKFNFETFKIVKFYQVVVLILLSGGVKNFSPRFHVTFCFQ